MAHSIHREDQKKPVPCQVGVLGLGRLGRALLASFKEIGVQASGRGREGHSLRMEAWVAGLDVVCLTVRDDQIRGVAIELGDSNLTGKTVLIFSGFLPLSDLECLRRVGARTGKCHPLQTFSRVCDLPIPAGTPFAVEGGDAVEALVAPWIRAWGGQLHRLHGDQWRSYHLAAVVAANFLPLWIRAGARILNSLAENEQQALDWLAPLVNATVRAALDADNHQPFSGPAVRGDQATITAHRALLAELMPDLEPLYRQCSEQIATWTKNPPPGIQKGIPAPDHGPETGTNSEQDEVIGRGKIS